MIWLKDYKYDGGGISDASLKSIHKRLCTRGGDPKNRYFLNAVAPKTSKMNFAVTASAHFGCTFTCLFVCFGWIFGKLPNGLWPPLLPHPYFRKQWCAFFWMCLNLQLKFLDRKWPPPSFWNFSKKSSKMEKGSVPEWAICKNLEHWCIAVCCQKLPKATISHQNLP